jgi:hypothetical protein
MHDFVMMMTHATMTAVLVLAACVREPIEWESPRDMSGTIAATTRLLMDADGDPHLVDETPPVVTLPPGACEASLATTRAQNGDWYAAWFIARPESSVVLVVSRSTDDGATWGMHVVADERDRGRRGCSRPRPALHADTASGYVHAAYFIEPTDGAGVWYTHSLERGALWHQTIGVLYGEEPASVSIASAGDTVLVAYQHPGSGGTRLGLAISRAAGHTFAERLRVVRANGTVRDPRVALRAGRVALAWTERTTPHDSSGLVRTRLRAGAFR